MSVSASWSRTRLLATMGIAAIGLLVLAGCTLPTTADDVETITGAPSVRIASPQSNATYLEGVQVNIQAAITNAGEDVDRVEITVDNVAVATIAEPNPSGAAGFSVTEMWPAPAAGSYTISVAAFRADGSSDSASVSISVVDQSAIEEDEPPTEEPTEEPATEAPPATEPPAQPTDPPQPTAVPATATPSVPTARFTTGINVRAGPGTNFNPPIGQFAPNQTAEILALNQTGSWLKVRYGSGEGWVFAQLVEVEGNVSGLPREVGPPTPAPTAIPPTAVPATEPPAAGADLVVENFGIDPAQPVCGQNFRGFMTIRNAGSTSVSTGLNQIRIRHVASDSVIRSSEGALVAVNLPPGGTHVVDFTFNVDVFVGEEQRIEFIADLNNEVQQPTDRSRRGVTYTLQGPC